MRALRFASSYGFKIGGATEESILKNVKLLDNVSAERKNAELCGFLMGKGCGDLMLKFAPVFTAVIPELGKTIGFDQLNPYHCFDIWEHTIHTVDNSPQVLAVRLAALFHDIAKPDTFSADETGTGHFYGHAEAGAEKTVQIMRRLKSENKIISAVHDLVYYHDRPINENTLSVKKILGIMGEESFFMLLELKKADILSQNAEYITRTKSLVKIKRIAEEIISQKQCFKLSDLDVNGEILISMGIPQGKQIGVILKDCMEKVMEGKLKNKKDDIIEYIKGTY
ncbi:MAG: HD domain-containing protein [Clostridia bacterium]|nr:HD domain-containing protein [Clostridia bacterium]